MALDSGMLEDDLRTALGLSVGTVEDRTGLAGAIADAIESIDGANPEAASASIEKLAEGIISYLDTRLPPAIAQAVINHFTVHASVSVPGVAAGAVTVTNGTIA